MSDPKHIDELLRDWPYEPSTLGVRASRGIDGRSVLQMRVDMGMLQLETEGRPDGSRPAGFETYFDFLQGEVLRYGDEFVLDDDQCSEIDREFVQYYHRRICWLRLQKYDRAVADADHTLGLMDFCRRHSAEEHWTMSHEQYRPFVMFHRTQAAALAELELNGAESAICEINSGLDHLRAVFEEFEAEEHFEDDELVCRLQELRETLRHEYSVGRTLDERLADAVATEQYELAARLRDELSRRK